jgi:tetratricopeptide (TPR) repeat protein
VKTPIENELKSALQEIDCLKTRACLDAVSIGLYAEDKLPRKERQKAEEHLYTCLYCLKLLNDTKELLYYRKHPAHLSPRLVSRLRAMCPMREMKSEKDSVTAPFTRKLKGFFTFPVRQWRYSAVSLTTACITIVISIFMLRSLMPLGVAPQIDANLFVNIRALSRDGKVLSEVQGVVVNSKGLIASNLYPLAGASALQITLKDGRTYQTRNVWRDGEKDLAVMKIDNEALPSIPMADINQISIGQSVFVVTDPDKANGGFKESLVSDFKQMPGRHKTGSIQYIQLATFTAHTTRGALVDGQGKLVGLLITEEKHINLAAPIADAERLVEEGKAIPLSELKGVKFSGEALNLYLKGILARDAQRWDGAIELFKKALNLNPDLEGAHLELGYLYYKKGLYALEAQEYENALRINPQNTDALFSLATNLETRGLYGQAIEEYEKAATLDPEDAERYYQLGLAYLAQGKKDRAMAIYRKLKALDPGYAEMLRRLSRS